MAQMPVTPVQGIQYPPLASRETACSQGTNTHAGKTPIHMKINNQEIVMIAMKKNKTKEVTEGEEIWQGNLNIWK